MQADGPHKTPLPDKTVPAGNSADPAREDGAWYGRQDPAAKTCHAIDHINTNAPSGLKRGSIGIWENMDKQMGSANPFLS